MARCRGPVNRLLMLRKRGISGPMFQRNTLHTCMKSVGNYWDALGVTHNGTLVTHNGEPITYSGKEV